MIASTSKAAVHGPSRGGPWRWLPSPGSGPARRRPRAAWSVSGGTAQDRPLSGLRLAGARTIDGANAVLADYLPRHDARFAVPPASAESAWRSLPAGRPPETAFCFRHPRSVARDGTFTPRRSQADDRWSLHGELEGTRAGGPGTARWDLLGGTRRRLPARRPGSRAAGRAARLRTSQALRPAARPSLVPLSCGQTTVPKSLTG